MIDAYLPSTTSRPHSPSLELRSSSTKDGLLCLSGVDVMIPPPIIKELVSCPPTYTTSESSAQAGDLLHHWVVAAAPIHDMFLGDALIVALPGDTQVKSRLAPSAPNSAPSLSQGGILLRCFIQRQSAKSSLSRAPVGDKAAEPSTPSAAEPSSPPASASRNAIPPSNGTGKTELQSQIDKHLRATYFDLVKPRQLLKLPGAQGKPYSFSISIDRMPC